jgi:pimeloyl-ACP methyl ester carboxylesterase
MAWHYSATGAGSPLILLHGIGMSHAAWHPVTPYLCETRRVVSFDIAGFGRTPALRHGTDPTIVNLAAGLARSLDELGIEAPVDIAGIRSAAPSPWKRRPRRPRRALWRFHRPVCGERPRLVM